MTIKEVRNFSYENYYKKVTFVLVNMFKREMWDKFTEFTFVKFRKFFKISKNEQGKFCPNFTNKHVIPG